MKIGVIGIGYVGLVQALGMYKIGYDLVCIDTNEEKIQMLKNNKIPFHEPGLKKILLNSGNIIFSLNIKELSKCKIIYICVGTPKSETNKTDLSYLFDVVKNLKNNLKGSHIIIIKSTVPVGTNRIISKKLGANFHVVSNPEFLKEGTALKDFLNPNKIVLGFNKLENKKIIKEVEKLYKKSFKSKIIITDWETSEIIKYSSNTFLAAKISLINEISQFCDYNGADIETVSYAIGLDSRIGKKFLNSGLGYGGSCLPKDVKSFIYQFKTNGFKPMLINKIDELNSNQIYYFLDKILNYYKGNISGKKISIFGLAFKEGVDDLRESRSIILIEELLKHNAILKVYDYNKNARKNFLSSIGLYKLKSNIEICRNFAELISHTDCLIFTQNNRKLRNENFSKLKINDNIIFDGVHTLSKLKLDDSFSPGISIIT